MPRHQYRPGDTVILKARVLGSTQPQGTGRIISQLPETSGSLRYRVQFSSENFERSIEQDDIDTVVSAATVHRPHRASDNGGIGSWVKTNAIRTRK